MENTAIEWCDNTWSPWEGCTKISPACANCYAAARNGRFSKGANWGAGAPRRKTVDWGKPRAWNKRAAMEGKQVRVFPSICDPFDNEVDPEWRAEFFMLMADTPYLTWQLLTKRIGNAKQMIREVFEILDEAGFNLPLWPWPHVWLGATICNQEEADRDIPKLLATPARVRFLSMEPLLGPVDLAKAGALWVYIEDGAIVNQREAASSYEGEPMIDWVIVGGESGPGARPMHPEWARSLRDQCAAAGVAFMFKQHGEWIWVRDTGATENDCDRGLWVRRDGTTHDGTECHAFTDGGTDALVWRLGKKAAGRLLDGRTHDGFPGEP